MDGKIDNLIFIWPPGCRSAFFKG